MYDGSSRRELGAALAAAFLAGAWTEDALVRRGAEVLEPRPPWLRAVVREVLAAYHRPAADRSRELAAYVVLALEERRGVAAAPRVRRWRDFAPAMARTRWPVPAIASPGELADRLGLDVGQLAWLADVRGLERRAPDKTRVRRRSDRQLVCGVVVNERLNVPRRDYDRFKAILHDAVRNGPAAANRVGVPDLRAHLLGRIAWVGALHPERGRRLRERLDAIAWDGDR